MVACHAEGGRLPDDSRKAVTPSALAPSARDSLTTLPIGCRCIALHGAYFSKCWLLSQHKNNREFLFPTDRFPSQAKGRKIARCRRYLRYIRACGSCLEGPFFAHNRQAGVTCITLRSNRRLPFRPRRRSCLTRETAKRRDFNLTRENGSARPGSHTREPGALPLRRMRRARRGDCPVAPDLRCPGRGSQSPGRDDPDSFGGSVPLPYGVRPCLHPTARLFARILGA